MIMGIRDVVVELSCGSTESESIREMMDEALKDMLRYDGGKVLQNNKAGYLKVRLDNFHPKRWESFGYKVVTVVEARGYFGRGGVYHPPEDLAWTVS